MADANYPGWWATKDDQETHVYQADYILRVIYLPPGAHEGRFLLQPSSFRLVPVQPRWWCVLDCCCMTLDGSPFDKGDKCPAISLDELPYSYPQQSNNAATWRWTHLSPVLLLLLTLLNGLFWSAVTPMRCCWLPT